MMETVGSPESGDLSIGTRVRKRSGYPFDGTVQAVFANRAGEYRVVVEMDRGFDGDILHIFNLSQMTEALEIKEDDGTSWHRLEALKLPTRVHNLLVDAGYKSVEEVRASRDLNAIKGYGFMASQIVQAALTDWEFGRQWK